MGILGHAPSDKSKDDEQKKQPEPEQQGEKQDESQQKWKFVICADKESTPMEMISDARAGRGVRTGHSWIQLYNPMGQKDSWGFWPDIWGGHAVDVSAPWKSVQGKVLHPDEEHSANAQHTYEISQEQAQKVQKAANAKEAGPPNYNLFTYNCTHFAAEMGKVAGVSVPSFSNLGIANPAALFNGIKAMNKKEGKDEMENALPNQGGGN